MSDSKAPAVVITSIYPPNAVMREIAARCGDHGYRFVIAGDSKSPADFSLDGATFLSIDDQREMGQYGRLCPERTYARKNLGYLWAIRGGATWVLETDDDNMPRESLWQDPDRLVGGRRAGHPGWINAYRYFADTFIYPRGYPIDRALPDWQSTDAGDAPVADDRADCPIQQGLADGNPDVDAVWRMLHPLPFSFRQDRALVLDEGCWCPFNSQNTIFFPEVFPLLYLPATCSFRMTDIWRSFIAQRILWTCGWRLSFHSASMFQDRNEHDLLADFQDELPGYLGNQAIVELLGELDLRNGPGHLEANLEVCYQAMISAGYFKPEEENLLDAWLSDLRKGQTS